MKLNAHNNPAQNKRPKKGKVKGATPTPRRHDDADNRRRRIEKDAQDKERNKNKVLHTPHGAARYARRMVEKLERALRRPRIITDRETAINLGLIKPMDTTSMNHNVTRR